MNFKSTTLILLSAALFSGQVSLANHIGRFERPEAPREPLEKKVFEAAMAPIDKAIDALPVSETTKAVVGSTSLLGVAAPILMAVNGVGVSAYESYITGDSFLLTLRELRAGMNVFTVSKESIQALLAELRLLKNGATVAQLGYAGGQAGLTGAVLTVSAAGIASAVISGLGVSYAACTAGYQETKSFSSRCEELGSKIADLLLRLDGTEARNKKLLAPTPIMAKTNPQGPALQIRSADTSGSSGTR